MKINPSSDIKAQARMVVSGFSPLALHGPPPQCRAKARYHHPRARVFVHLLVLLRTAKWWKSDKLGGLSYVP